MSIIKKIVIIVFSLSVLAEPLQLQSATEGKPARAGVAVGSTVGAIVVVSAIAFPIALALRGHLNDARVFVSKNKFTQMLNSIKEAPIVQKVAQQIAQGVDPKIATKPLTGAAAASQIADIVTKAIPDAAPVITPEKVADLLDQPGLAIDPTTQTIVPSEQTPVKQAVATFEANIDLVQKIYQGLQTGGTEWYQPFAKKVGEAMFIDSLTVEKNTAEAFGGWLADSLTKVAYQNAISKGLSKSAALSEAESFAEKFVQEGERAVEQNLREVAGTEEEEIAKRIVSEEKGIVTPAIRKGPAAPPIPGEKPIPARRGGPRTPGAPDVTEEPGTKKPAHELSLAEQLEAAAKARAGKPSVVVETPKKGLTPQEQLMESIKAGKKLKTTGVLKPVQKRLSPLEEALAKRRAAIAGKTKPEISLEEVQKKLAVAKTQAATQAEAHTKAVTALETQKAQLEALKAAAPEGEISVELQAKISQAQESLVQAEEAAKMEAQKAAAAQEEVERTQQEEAAIVAEEAEWK